MIDKAERALLAADPRLGAGNLLHELLRRGRPREQAVLWFDPAWRGPDGRVRCELTLGQLYEAVSRYAAWYAGRGVRPRDPVVVHAAHAVDCLVHYLALTGLGAIPALVNANLTADVARSYVARLGAVGVVVDEACGAAYRDDPGWSFAVIQGMVGRGAPEEPPQWYPYQHDDGDPVLITHSSGTTGPPKAVVATHRSLYAGVRHRLRLPFPHGGDRILSALPPSHNSAIALALHALANGVPTYLLSSQSADELVPAIARFRPSLVTAFAATYADLASRDLSDARPDLDSVAVWWNSGDAAHEPLIRRLVEVGSGVRVTRAGREQVSGSMFVDGLGSSEMGHSLFYNVHRQGTANYRRCVGRPFDFVRAAVLDETGRELPAGEVGLLGVRSPSVTPGYWNDSATTYRSRLRGYWLTGDLVYRDRDGRFFHVDRVSDAVRTRQGPLYSVQAEELLMRRVPNVADCAVLGIEREPGGHSEVLVLIRPVGSAERDWTKEVNAVLVAEGLPRATAAKAVSDADLALGPTGKVRKRELRARYERLIGGAR
jgi:acyl-coenzyme A synthetase/AMP-(fatty) acid ligase